MISVTAAPVIGITPFRNALSTKAWVVGVESLVGDDVTELLVAPDFDEASPVFFDVRVEGYSVDEREDQVALVAQRDARVDGPPDLRQCAVSAVATFLALLLDEHQDVALCRLDVFGKTEAAGQRRVGEEGDLGDLLAAQREGEHAPGRACR